jgi:CO/xanthine dehydrogenase Mo-binding subunit
VTTTADKTSQPHEFKVIGTRPIRHDGVDKVTGRARYGADISMPGLLHGKILRSPLAHARIKHIDTSRAEKLPGVRAIVTSRDFPIASNKTIDWGEAQGNVRMMAANIMAEDKVLYKGHAIAAVAATDVHIAEEALKLIDVEYEPLPPILSIRDAMKPDAPLIHDNLTTFFRVERFGRGEDTHKKSNVAGHLQFKRGDVEKGFKEADIIVEREFETQTVHQGYIEPHASTALWSPDGKITVWTSTQGTFAVRASTAAILGVPESQVKVIPMEIGGGFGAKLTTYLDPVAAMMSKKAGAPVKMVMTRKEVFEGTGPASGTLMRCKMGVKKDGTIVAGELMLAFEAGAFPGSSVGGGALCGFGPYKMEHLLVDGYDVVVNKQKAQAYRAPGQPQAAFAVESVVDELAQKVGMDPMEFRLKNVTHEGDRMPSGMPFPRIGLEEMERAMRDHPHYRTPLKGPNRGRGIAVGYRFNAGGVSSATLNVNDDGTVTLITGAVDIGGTRTSVAMQAAEVLGIPVSQINPTVVDTDTIGWTGSTGGSRVTFDTGLAAMAAAEDVIKQMKERAALQWEVKPEDVDYKDGVFYNKRSPTLSMSFKQLAGTLRRNGGPITCSAANRTTGVGPIFAGNIVDVEVDPETGKVKVLRCTAFMDTGKAVHPSYVEGQLQGGTVQGIGWALNEEYFYTQDGTMANSTFLDYRMPTTLDVPMIDTVLVEVPNPRHPFGLRGVGEAPIVPPLAALANAVSAATGVRMTKLPLSPGNILEAVKNAKAKK